MSGEASEDPSDYSYKVPSKPPGLLPSPAHLSLKADEVDTEAAAALAAVAAAAAEARLSGPASVALARRFDLRLLAPLTFLYFICYLDRANLANAKADVQMALSLSDTQYGLASSIFQVGYIACEVPANIVLKLWSPSLWLGLLVASFGVVAAATAGVVNYAGLLVVRIALGVAEAGFPPGVLYVLSMWYRPSELGARNAIFLVAGPLANAMGAILAYGILQLNGVAGLAGWQWLFLLEGLPAIALGAATMLLLPDSPAHAGWLSPAEKQLAIDRVPLAAGSSADKAGGGHHFVWVDVLALLLSPITWSFALLNVSTNVASYGIGAFLPAIIKELGYSSLEANLRTAPIYFFMAFFNIVTCFFADRINERGWVIVVCLLGSGVGMALLAVSLLANWPLGLQYFLCFLLVFYSATSPLMIAWLVKAYRGSSDAAIGPALILTIGSLGGFVGPIIYGSTSGDGGTYVRGHWAMCGVFFAGAALAAGMRVAFYERPGDGRLVYRPWKRGPSTADEGVGLLSSTRKA